MYKGCMHFLKKIDGQAGKCFHFSISITTNRNQNPCAVLRSLNYFKFLCQQGILLDQVEDDEEVEERQRNCFARCPHQSPRVDVVEETACCHFLKRLFS